MILIDDTGTHELSATERLRLHLAMEHEDVDTPALVYQVPPVASVQEAAMDQRTRWLASTDPALCGERDDELLAVL